LGFRRRIEGLHGKRSTNNEISIQHHPVSLQTPSVQLDPFKPFQVLSISRPLAVCVRYTQLLHEYNDIRDVGQGLMELIADARGVRQVN
jgi:hypothetical protein